MSSYYEKILATGEVKCIDEEIPFEIPQGWEWCRICHVAEIARGGSPRPIKEYLTDATDGVNWIKIGDTEKDSKYITSVKEKIKQSGMSKSRMVHKGDFLLTNSMSFGRPYITQVDGCIHDGWLVISLIEQSYRQDFFYHLLSSGYAYSQFANRVAGAVVQNLNSEKVAISLFPLPPYKEQKRIVQKIEELLPLVEKFGNNITLLDKLNADINTRLKKSILQEAIQGRLVPQIAEEGTAQELLEQIKAEKQKLVKEGKLKKSALNDSVIFRGDDNKYYEKVGKKTVCIEDEVPFKIPGRWGWCRLRQICNMQAGKNISANKIFSEQSPSHHYKCIGGNGLRGFTDIYNVEGHYAIIGRQGALCGCVNIADGRFYATEHAVIVDTFNLISPNFMFYYLTALNLNKYATATAQPGLAVSKVMEILSPLPPLKEQQRIVAQIEKLFEQLR